MSFVSIHSPKADTIRRFGTKVRTLSEKRKGKAIYFFSIIHKTDKRTMAGRNKMEGTRRTYVVADDVHDYIMRHGGGKWLTETVRTIKAVSNDQE